VLIKTQVYVNAPNEASGLIPEDVKPYFDGPYYEWWNAEKVIAQTFLLSSVQRLLCNNSKATEASHAGACGTAIGCITAPHLIANL